MSAWWAGCVETRPPARRNAIEQRLMVGSGGRVCAHEFRETNSRHHFSRTGLHVSSLQHLGRLSTWVTSALPYCRTASACLQAFYSVIMPGASTHSQREFPSTRLERRRTYQAGATELRQQPQPPARGRTVVGTQIWALVLLGALGLGTFLGSSWLTSHTPALTCPQENTACMALSP